MTPPLSGDERSAATQEAIYAALEALQTAMDADLCAFLTESGDQGPQLFLGVPDLGAVNPNKAFALFTSLREALAQQQEPADLVIAGYQTLLVPLASVEGRALLAVGRRRESPTPSERDSAVRFGHALVRLLEVRGLDAGEPRPRVVRLGIESSADRCDAQVSLDLGEQVSHGNASDPMPLRAVAAATMDAAGELAERLKLAHVVEGDIGSSRAVLALLLDDQGRSWLGSALVEETADPLHAAARATVAAVHSARTEG